MKAVSGKILDEELSESKQTNDCTAEDQDGVEDFMKTVDEYHRKLSKEENSDNESDTTNYDMEISYK